ncbi:MAG: hypothetical protein ACYTKD_23840 [Planctomycetota bacterium]
MDEKLGGFGGRTLVVRGTKDDRLSPQLRDKVAQAVKLIKKQGIHDHVELGPTGSQGKCRMKW